MDIAVTGNPCGPNSLVEPLSTTLPGRLQVAATVVDASKSHFIIQVTNPTCKGISLRKRMCLGTIQVAGVTMREQLKFAVGSNEVVVSCATRADCMGMTLQAP